MNPAIEKAVDQERARQLELWGEQRHSNPSWLAILVEEVGEVAEHCCPFSPPNPRALATELVQIMAVCHTWLVTLGVREKEKAVVDES